MKIEAKDKFLEGKLKVKKIPPACKTHTNVMGGGG